MVKVRLWGSLRGAVDGAEEVEICDVANFKDLLDGLSRDYPALRPQIKRGVSVSVDGVIYREAWFTPLSEDNEIVLIPYMTGG